MYGSLTEWLIQPKYEAADFLSSKSQIITNKYKELQKIKEIMITAIIKYSNNELIYSLYY